LLLWVGIVAGYYAVLFRVYLPATWPDPAYKPGTLTRLGDPAPDFSLKTLARLLPFFEATCGIAEPVAK
jgi:hypothetical protein